MQAATLTSPVPAEAVAPVQLVDIDTLAKVTADSFDVNDTHFDAVMNCESGGLDTAKGDHGLAYGPFQFHENTFNWMKAEAIKEGEPFGDLKYLNPQDQITLAAWAFSKGMESNWSCWKIEQAKDWQ